MASDDCIFCKIASGAIPARKVLETGDCVAFLDVAPLAPGHTLLIPRHHGASLEELPGEAASSMFGCLPALSRAVLTATGAEGLNVLINRGKAAGQEVMHVHVHLIPRRAGDGLGYRWRPQPLDPATADEFCRTIAAALSS